MTETEIFRRIYRLAGTSPDRSNQNAAAVLRGGEIFAVGVNRYHAGISARIVRECGTDREAKLRWIEHAERAAIYCAAATGVPTEGATLYCPWVACVECARAIAFSGFARVVCHRERQLRTPDRWKPSVESGLEILRECGVEVVEWTGSVGCEPILVEGEPWHP